MKTVFNVLIVALLIAAVAGANIPAQTGSDHPLEYVAGQCTMWGDPHITTFDGIYYSYQGLGWFWMMISPQVSIDAHFYDCNGNGGATCADQLRVNVWGPNGNILTFRSIISESASTGTTYLGQWGNREMHVRTMFNGADTNPNMVPAIVNGEYSYAGGAQPDEIVTFPGTALTASYSMSNMGYALALSLPYAGEGFEDDPAYDNWEVDNDSNGNDNLKKRNIFDAHARNRRREITKIFYSPRTLVLKPAYSIRGHTCGLCGTLDGDQTNDFISPAGHRWDITDGANIDRFSDSWQNDGTNGKRMSCNPNYVPSTTYAATTVSASTSASSTNAATVASSTTASSSTANIASTTNAASTSVASTAAVSTAAVSTSNDASTSNVASTTGASSTSAASTAGVSTSNAATTTAVDSSTTGATTTAASTTAASTTAAVDGTTAAASYASTSTTASTTTVASSTAASTTAASTTAASTTAASTTAATTSAASTSAASTSAASTSAASTSAASTAAATTSAASSTVATTTGVTSTTAATTSTAASTTAATTAGAASTTAATSNAAASTSTNAASTTAATTASASTAAASTAAAATTGTRAPTTGTTGSNTGVTTPRPNGASGTTTSKASSGSTTGSNSGSGSTTGGDYIFNDHITVPPINFTSNATVVSNGTITDFINSHQNTPEYSTAVKACDNAGIPRGSYQYQLCLFDVLATNNTGSANDGVSAAVMSCVVAGNNSLTDCFIGTPYECPQGCNGNGKCTNGKCDCELGYGGDSCYKTGLNAAEIAGVVSASAVAGIAIGAAVFVGVTGFGAKKGYDYLKNRDNNMGGVSSNPLYQEKKAGGTNPLYDTKA